MPEFPSISPVGPRDNPRLAIVGDYPNDDEARTGIPFTGRDERNLRALLEQAGVKRSECYLTKVFLEKPMMQDMSDWTHTKTELKALGLKTSRAPISKGRYLHPGRLDALERLKRELEIVKPNMILALGSIPMWALTSETSLMKSRGSVTLSTLIPGQKVLPTYELFKLITQWDLYPIISVDYQKAYRLSNTRENIIPSRKVWINPTLADLDQYYAEHIDSDSGVISIDIETQQKQITCIGFGSTRSSAIVVPFWQTKRKWVAGDNSYHYWSDAESEVAAMRWCKKVLDHPRAKVFQNGMYDLTYLWKVWGMPTRNPREDTMLLHHSLQPELMKGLGFLGSCYTDEVSWKGMRTKNMDTEKRDE